MGTCPSSERISTFYRLAIPVWTFHNVVVQGRQRNVQHVQSCCFPHKKNPIVFQTFQLPSPSWYRKVPNDVDSGAICSKNGLKFDYFLHKKKVFLCWCCFFFLFCLVSFFLFSHLSNFPLSPASLDSTFVAIGYLPASSPQASSTLYNQCKLELR